ncbi:MAG: Rieske (2Fe-2S) protein [Gomphosphaeria aponina SAG 52.96 = DSM 107014]|uniref:Rieske (2Fe-2S) protein n=1 Tax=Gomphosphaeria aponina SAG 52.96 = DSM 107014 TaxID=1521640 RepID=A0A941JRE7_9CHRO|nr:Rieske (2Fe-2S) protein [Gomphosphaeria aponina SAG 52.96 = DSM 107014]
MKRRKFFTWVGVGGFLSFLPTIIAACSPKNVTSESNNSQPVSGMVTVGTVAELDQEGFILNKEFAGGKVLVIRNPAATDTLLAVNPTCPHEGCTVKWEGNDKQYVCPCHNAKYGPEGTFISGPVEKPLATFTAKIEGDAVVVQ